MASLSASQTKSEMNRRAWETSSLVLCEIIQSEWYTYFVISVNRKGRIPGSGQPIVQLPVPFAALRHGRTRRYRRFGEPIKALVLEVDVPERQENRFPFVVGTLDLEIGSVPLKQAEDGDAAIPDVQVHLTVPSCTDARH